jgi:hypothetical protein
MKKLNDRAFYRRLADYPVKSNRGGEVFFNNIVATPDRSGGRFLLRVRNFVRAQKPNKNGHFLERTTNDPWQPLRPRSINDARNHLVGVSFS